MDFRIIDDEPCCDSCKKTANDEHLAIHAEEKEHPNRPDITMISFGAPRVGRHYFARLYDKTVALGVRVVNSEDPITRLPPLYVHTDGEVVVPSCGTVTLCQSLTNSAKERIREMPSVDSLEELDTDSASLDAKSMKSRLRVASHTGTSYFEVIRTAVDRHFNEEKNRGFWLPMISRSDAIDRQTLDMSIAT